MFQQILSNILGDDLLVCENKLKNIINSVEKKNGSIKHILTDNVDTVSFDSGIMFWNPGYMLKTEESKLEFLCHHEIMHWKFLQLNNRIMRNVLWSK
jgi:predicted metal-dependent peptidase